MTTSRPPVVFLAFANDRVEPARYLRDLVLERRRLLEVLAGAEQAGLCEVVDRANATIDEILGVFQNAAYRNRIAVFHFGGHANSGALLFESPEGAPAEADASGFARFLGQQRGIELVFLNGCSTRGQVRGLLDAGVAAVIATDRLIDDKIATEFAVCFYRSLASGTSISHGYAEASAAAQMRFAHPMLLPAGRNGEPWPWHLDPTPGVAEGLDRWTLPLAAGDPFFGLPALPDLDFPPSPFRYLAAFTRREAPVFFGRGREIRELFEALTRPDGAPIVLLFGATGAGKSSLLAAGLQPRLEGVHDVLYLRRDAALGLTATLARGLGGAADGGAADPAGTVAASWHQREAATGRPLTVILDQAEEAWTRPLTGGIEADEFATALRFLFVARQARPRGRLLLSFRKEWLAEVLRLLDGDNLYYQRVELAQLGFAGIVDAATGRPSSARMRRHYGLEVEPDLPTLLAADLLADPAATVAPALQILLTKMWSQASQVSPAAPRFTVALYQGMKRHGVLLDDFLEEQLHGLAQWRPEVVGSGLALDLLVYHTTALGSAESRQADEIGARYGRPREIAELLDQCQQRFLLTIALPEPGIEPRAATADPPRHRDGKTTRLAHDTLAPLVRRRFDTSDLPGQRALRILEQRARQWQGGREGPPLDEFDLAQVDGGHQGMRLRTTDEARLVAASRRRQERRKRQRFGLQLAAFAAVAMILLAALGALRQRNLAVRSEERAQDRATSVLASSLTATHPIEAALMLLEVREPDSTPLVSSNLYWALAEPLEAVTLAGHTDRVLRASFSADGARVITASEDNTARIWDAATGRPLATLAHQGGISAASFSPDGRRVVTASRDHTAAVWDAATGRRLVTLSGHTAWVSTASWSSDGARIVTASADRTARIWNAATGRLITTLTFAEGVDSASFSPDGTRVLTAADLDWARIWDASSGRLIATLTDRYLSDVIAPSFSPNGSLVVTAALESARIWDAATGEPVATLDGHQSFITSAAFSPNGRLVVTASNDHTAKIWDADFRGPGRLLATLGGHAEAVWSASFSGDGTRIVTASADQTARIWDAVTGQPIGTLIGHTHNVESAAFSPDGGRVVTASYDHTARIWNATASPPEVTLSDLHSVESASFSPDGARVLTTSGPAQVWDAFTGRLIAILGQSGLVTGASFSPDGTRVVAAVDNTARIWNAATQQQLAILTGHRDTVMTAAFSPDGTRVVTASADKTARTWDARTGQAIAVLAGHTADVSTAAFSADGIRVLTTSNDKTVRIWNAATGRSLVTLDTEANAATFDIPGTRVATESFDHPTQIWDAATGRLLATLAENGCPLWSPAFSPDNTRLMTGILDESVRIWDAASGRPILALVGHKRTVRAAAFSRDSSRAVTASEDGTVHLWDTTTGQPLGTLAGEPDETQFASFSPDGNRVLAVSRGTVRIWPTGGEHLQSRVRSRSRICLSTDFRRLTLGESLREAAAHENACRDCLPRFFARLNGVPAGDSQVHVAAWREYRRCLAATP